MSLLNGSGKLCGRDAEFQAIKESMALQAAPARLCSFAVPQAARATANRRLRASEGELFLACVEWIDTAGR